MPNQTPGVYIEEINPVPNAIVPVETSIPAFIGFTEKVILDGKNLTNVPYRIESLLEFEEIFGTGYSRTYSLSVASSPQEQDFALNGISYALKEDPDTYFLLYDSIKLFFMNGGRNCYIVSVGTYSGTRKGMHYKSIKPFTEGIDELKNEKESSILVIPDAVAFKSNDCYRIQEYMLMHCGQEKNRFAILDIHEGYKNLDDPNFNPIENFRNNVSSNSFSYGAAYYPWLNTNIIDIDEVNFKSLNLESIQTLIGIFENSMSKSQINEIKQKIAETNSSASVLENEDQTKTEEIHNILSTSIPEYNILMEAILKKKNILPPSAAMAGIYAKVDSERGVWKAPANRSFNFVDSPTVVIDQAQNNELNAPTSGRSICAIRLFTGKGTLVWGARTLDGNNYEWKYIPIRRTMIMIEQSINNGLTQLAFMPNTAATWSSTKSLISNFLNNLWRQGALAGAKSEEAFFVAVGLGTTMTSQDVIHGIIKIQVGVALTKPAEFIVIKFQQQTQNA
ncbi:phage tail sheath family protein [Brumimicrobium mesophilum]|uniref:phage tail sheath family protein n=1 Tax=Brumimicrobium mesophilum TaxID=392717 RepID=UPI000D1433A0|nr:phage tail sheath C-terminal domain-containing protein [Brumimicrobium mesophilum]